MRIKNKYLRNRHFRRNCWNRVCAKEQPYKTHMPCNTYNPEYVAWILTTEQQVENHFSYIEKTVRAIDKGSHRAWAHAPASFRKFLNRGRKALERKALAKIQQGDYEVEVPTFKNDADWLYF